MTDAIKNTDSVKEIMGAPDTDARKIGKIEKFRELVDTIQNLDEKKKFLWMNIYENAVQDRENAHAFLFEISSGLSGQTTDHHLIGPTIAKYIERMSKANDQLLKLAELLQKAQEEADTVDEDSIWAELEKEDS